MARDRIRVLIVDDAAVYRRIIRDILERCPGIEVAGTAANGKIALDRIRTLRPDIVTLDVEMPEMDGLAMLRALVRQQSEVGVIMLSAFTSEGAKLTLAALELGAFDFVLKPGSDSYTESFEKLSAALCSKIEAFASTLQLRRLLNRNTRQARQSHAAETRRGADTRRGIQNLASARTGRPNVVALGTSTGGPRALMQMLPELPGDLPVPVLVVQHMPPVFTKSLADSLDRHCALSVDEAHDGQLLAPGHVLLAPGGKQMKVVAEPGGVCIRLTDDPRENGCRPSADYLFRSVSQTYGPNAVGVIMTGMGDDGAEGCRLMKRRGAAIVAQDQASCVVFGMPKRPVEEGVADAVVPLDRISTEIVSLVKREPLPCP